MSRIGKRPVTVPGGVTVKLSGTLLEVSGPKGQLKRETYGRIKFVQEKETINVELASEAEGTKFWGLYRSLLANMVEGCSTGYKKELELHGVGYRANMSGKTLNLTVGLSHPVSVEAPQGINFEVDKTGKVGISGADKELVGQMAAKIRGIRPPEPYHGKGIRYSGEVIVTKVGKSAGKK